MWFGPLKRFQKLFFHTPLVNVFVVGQRGLSRLLPLAAQGQEDVRRLESDHAVGQLFDRYGRGEAGPTRQPSAPHATA